MADVGTEVTYIDLVRHGHVATPGLFCAASEEPLSEVGWQELSTTTDQARADIIVTSPSRRCREFAAQYALKRGHPLQVLDGFQEMDFGGWIGQSTESIWAQDEALLSILWESPLEFVAPGGEKMPDFIHRVRTSWKKVLEEYAGGRVLLFTHGGVIRVLLALALDIPYQKTLGFDLPYGSAARMRVYADGGVSIYGVGVESL